jgi:hypothetical protein
VGHERTGVVPVGRHCRADRAGDERARCAVVVSAFEQHVTAMRAYMRVAVAIARPLQPDGSGATVPFELADWTAGAAATEASSRGSRKR